MAVAIRRPVAEGVDYARMRAPDPAVFARAGPLAVVVEIFGAPNIFVEVLRIVARTLREITLAITDPFVNSVARTGSEQVPVARVVARGDQFGGTPVAQRESGSVGIDAGTAAVTHS